MDKKITKEIFLVGLYEFLRRDEKVVTIDFVQVLLDAWLSIEYIISLIKELCLDWYMEAKIIPEKYDLDKKKNMFAYQNAVVTSKWLDFALKQLNDFFNWKK